MSSEKKQMNQAAGCFMLLLMCVIYGLGDPVSKHAYQQASVYSILSVRYTIAAIILWLLFGKKTVAELKKCNVRNYIIPVVGIAMTYILSNVALKYTQATSVAFLRSTSVIMTPALLFLVYHKKLKTIHVAIMAVVVVGLYLLCCGNGLSGFGIGEILGLATAIISAEAIIATGPALKYVGTMTMTTLEVTASAVFVIIFSFFMDGGVSLQGFNGTIWISIAYLSLLCTIGGFLLKNTALSCVSVRVASTLMCFNPVMTAVFSFFLLGERLSTKGLIGAGIILVCVILQSILKD